MFKKQFLRGWRVFINPGVGLFILLGTGIIFLTFFTENNALEIVISGVASIFIGIGINNFTTLETRINDERVIKLKVAHALQVLDMIREKVKSMQQHTQYGDTEMGKINFTELESLLLLLRALLHEEENLHP
ncbi:MAG: hypothetical protein IT254_01650 [Chitinophagaceae bacterium]|nr:hypothetical protein [Bacteroidota bacterium]MCC6257005.1 hypothetical protein [Chitinophagaceae bacterium]MCW5917685.1 hypothetical protein [Ferruginibacter sp.]